MADKLTKKQERGLSEAMAIIQDVVDDLDNLGTVSREFSIALTKLEESEMWIHRGFEKFGYEPEEEDPDAEDGDEDEGDEPEGDDE
ncbi:MAG: hypothetical protein DRH30_04890 [Deltaproteobacteria bacterium]|nr:MAG: hypothetical protein DRH30_04890 [Deltaproteobacteria bacterium]